MINDELFDKNLVRSTKGVENYISNSKDKFKHFHKRNTKYSWRTTRLRDVVNAYLSEELNTSRSSYKKSCDLIQDDFNRFKKWVNEQRNRDFGW